MSQDLVLQDVIETIMRNVTANTIDVGNGVYKINKKEYRRVTSILSSLQLNSYILEKWKQKVIKNKFIAECETIPASPENALIKLCDALKAPDEELRKASKLGSTCHTQFEGYLKDNTYQLIYKDSIQQNIISSFNLFAKDPIWDITKKYQTVGCEIPLWSDKFHYAGTMDYLAFSNGKLYIFDWKTSNHAKVTYLLQLAAYWKAIEEQYNFPVEEAYIVNFKKDGSYPQIITLNKGQLDYFFNMFAYLVCLQQLGDIKL